VKGCASILEVNSCARSTIYRVAAVIAFLFAGTSTAQNVPYQRTFPQSKDLVEKRLKELQSSSAGHLPVLEGFTVPGDRPLDHFRHGYYQCTAQVGVTPSGASIVRVSAIISAWYTDPASGKSDYQVLPSNGRLEADFLDRLQDALGDHGSSSNPTLGANRSRPSPSAPRSQANPPKAALPAAQPAAPGAGSKTPVGSPFNLGSPLSLDRMPSLATQKAVIDRHAEEQAKEVKGLEEILHNQAHPANLAAVKKKETPVLATPIENAKVLFLASAEDEFEILDANPNWVHVRISGISRGWIRRSSLEMPTADPDPPPAQLPTQTDERSQPSPADAQPFHVENEEIASFPGNWGPLLGKTVKIVTVQKAVNDAGVTGPEAKLAYAKSLFGREYSDLIRTSSSVAGVVVIFDSEDGGMIAATMPALGQWKSVTLSDQAFWHRCFFDPREAFGLVGNP
jgi:hypothetical protein